MTALGWPDIKKALSTLPLLALAGCFNLAAASSGQIGCPANDISITNDEAGFAIRTWTAQCRGQTYFCSSQGRGPQISCAPAMVPPPGVPAPTGVVLKGEGCQYDTQCKGDRVCRDRLCVDPGARGPAPLDAGAR